MHSYSAEESRCMLADGVAGRLSLSVVSSSNVSFGFGGELAQRSYCCTVTFIEGPVPVRP